MKQEKTKNKYRFWLGVSMFGLEFLALGIYGFSKLDFSWMTIKLAKIITLGALGILINIFAFWLVKDGSKQ